jgi:hypothetical protein
MSWRNTIVMVDDQIFRCQNPACRSEMRVLRRSLEGGSNPRCSCGAQMKKPYRKPQMRTVKSEFGVLASYNAGRG